MGVCVQPRWGQWTDGQTGSGQEGHARHLLGRRSLFCAGEDQGQEHILPSWAPLVASCINLTHTEAYKERWAPKNWCFWTVVLEKTLESPLDCKEIQPVHPKGNQSWTFIGRTETEVETPILWLPDENWLTGKELMLGKIEGGRRGDGRGWDGWMASPTQWTWAWVNSRSWWWTGKPVMLRSMGSQRVGHDWVTELNRCEDSWALGIKGPGGGRE